jgi:hypothetical protein
MGAEVLSRSCRTAFAISTGRIGTADLPRAHLAGKRIALLSSPQLRHPPEADVPQGPQRTRSAGGGGPKGDAQKKKPAPEGTGFHVDRQRELRGGMWGGPGDRTRLGVLAQR